MTEQELADMSAELMRRELASVDLSDIDVIKSKLAKLSPKELLARAVSAESFYKNQFSDELELFLQAQLEFMGKKATGISQFIFAKGTFNGICLVKEWFEKKIREADESRPDAPEDISNITPTGLEG